MMARATLTIDPKLHARAKQLARRRRTTVSGLFGLWGQVTNFDKSPQSSFSNSLSASMGPGKN